MNELDRIIDQLQRAHNGDAWHGDPLMKILEGIAAETATRKPLNSHSIWELVAHITAWQREATRRIREKNYRSLPPEQDWPAVTATTERSWKTTIEALEESHQQLVDAIRKLDPSLLDQVLPGSLNTSYYVVLHGIIQHTLYHAGQIAVLKKRVITSHKS